MEALRAYYHLFAGAPRIMSPTGEPKQIVAQLPVGMPHAIPEKNYVKKKDHGKTDALGLSKSQILDKQVMVDAALVKHGQKGKLADLKRRHVEELAEARTRKAKVVVRKEEEEALVAIFDDDDKLFNIPDTPPPAVPHRPPPMPPNTLHSPAGPILHPSTGHERFVTLFISPEKPRRQACSTSDSPEFATEGYLPASTATPRFAEEGMGKHEKNPTAKYTQAREQAKKGQEELP